MGGDLHVARVLLPGITAERSPIYEKGELILHGGPIQGQADSRSNQQKGVIHMLHENGPLGENPSHGAVWRVISYKPTFGQSGKTVLVRT